MDMPIADKGKLAPLNAETRPVAQALLQARLDGRLTPPTDIIDVIGSNQPPAGLLVHDMATVNEFIRELGPCNVIPEAKKLAVKYALNIAY